MADKCPDCGRLLGEGSSSDGFCWRRGDKKCRTLLVANLRSQLRSSEAELAQSRENEATEARRVDELLQDRSRARNETLAALEKLAASEAECERLRREVEDVRKLDEWLREDKWHQVVLDLGIVRGESISLLFHDERYNAVHRVEESFSAARRAAVEYLEKERKDG